MEDAKISLVTGANRGIGKEIVSQLVHDYGFKVILGSRDLSKGEAAAAGIGGDVRAIELDVSSPKSVTRVLEVLSSDYGHLDAVVNNAGVDYDTDQLAKSADLGRVRRAFDTNLFGAWEIAIQAIPLLRKGTQPRLVNVSSGAGSLTGMGGGTPGYGISKAALNALTIKLADEVRGDGILVNAICPGWVATDMGGGGRPVSEGAKGAVWAATLPEGGPTGGFFRDGKPIDW